MKRTHGPECEFGEWAVGRLKEMGCTALQMCQEIDGDQVSFSRHIHGKNIPSIVVFERYFNFLAKPDENFFDIYFKVIRDYCRIGNTNRFNKTYFGIWIQHAMYCRDLDPWSLGELVHRNWDTVRQHIFGSRGVSFKTCIAYAEVFGVDRFALYDIYLLGRIIIDDSQAINRFFDLLSVLN